MAASELSDSFNDFRAEGHDDHVDMNVDEFLQTTIEEAANQQDSYDESKESLHVQGLGSLSKALIHRMCTRMKISLDCVHCFKEGTVDNVDQLCICSGCRGRTYHKKCWPKARFHILTNHSPIVCKQPIEFVEYVWINYLLQSQTEPDQQATSHRADLWSSWFNVPNRHQRGRLYVYPRLQLLINKAQALRDDSGPTEQFPSLVSFFGETGGGKSTIISVLIRNAALNFLNDVPIPGNHAEKYRSTSAGVHLYCDPKTIDSDVPLFYADSEGLRGSAVPVATHSVEGDIRVATRQYRSRDHTRDRASSNPRGILDEHRETAVRSVTLQWAKSHVSRSDTETFVMLHPKTRQIVVEELYPRLLYTFSDVVCYVTNNPRATEHELDQLFQWAFLGHERTVNQRIRPGLIIVINKDGPDSDERWLDIDFATTELLRQLELSTRFEDLKEEWRLRGRRISTAEDLILCYYDSFRIVCIPTLTPETTHEIMVQYSRLYKEIQDLSRRLRTKKKQAYMHLNVRRFCTYVESVYSRLARDLQSSVDFHYLAIRNASRPTNFRDHVVALLVKLRDEEENVDPPCDVQEAELIHRVIPFLACCIASQCIDNSTQRAAMIQSSLDISRQALERFRETSWRCEKISGQDRCRNFWDGHEKGHQFSRQESDTSPRHPSLIVGAFQCTWDPEGLIQTLWAQVCQQEEGEPEVTFPDAAKRSGVRNVRSNRTCFTCLLQCPVYILPCEYVQHTICSDCAVKFNYSHGRSHASLCLTHCPLGCRFKGDRPWHSRIKPPAAGARILSLDGGGVRGIIELMILQKVLDQVGFGIPIQELFDLAIGTSTGGIIALGLFKMGWSVQKAIVEFQRLSGRAFSDHIGIPMFRHTAQLLYSHRYAGEGLDLALQTAFGDGLLFGSKDTPASEKVKVGVLAGVPGGRRPYLFTNYSRNHTGQNTDYLVREDDLEDELKCWEAARCTAAAPTYFPPFYHQAKRQPYIDGALLRNNPIQILEEERQAIWRDKAPPDILLSIGTGIQVDVNGSTKSAGKRQKIGMRLLPKGLRGWVAAGLDVVQSTVDCNRQWDEFVNSKRWDRNTHRVCHRLNIGLTERPPKLDDVEAIMTLKSEATRYLHHKGPGTAYLNKRYRTAHKHIAAVARRLTAALFYFESTPVDEGGESGGVLHCRLSSAMRDNFRRLLNEQPKFRVCQKVRQDRWSCTTFGAQFDERTFAGTVSFRAISEDIVIEMTFPGWNGCWERISGFPALR